MRILLLLACLVLSLAGSETATPPLLSPVFGEHMVLQRGKPTRLWGWAQPGTPVTVRFAGQEKTATTDNDGQWLVALDSLAASADATRPRRLFHQS
jgi:sialate O-acetylesterase